MSDSEGTGTKYTSPLEGVTIESIQLTLDLYRTGKAGVPIDTLWQFACPILHHYQLELTVAPDTDVTPENVEDATLMLDLLETASMIWDYCALEPQKKLRALDSLIHDLLGHSPARQESEQFMHLLSTMEALWFTLASASSEKDAQWSPCEDPEWRHIPPSQNGNSHYGPEQLDIPEAFALFSRPLLEKEDVIKNPDLLELAMTRAQAYWDLAHIPSEQFEHQLDLFVKESDSAGVSSSELRNEAHEMILHFRTLFPERQ